MTKLGFKGIQHPTKSEEIIPHGWQKAPASPAVNSHQALLTKFGKKILNEKIEKLAYYKWEAAGRPEGQDMRFWEEAEKEICIQAKA